MEGGVWWQERLAKEFSAPHLVAMDLSHLTTLKNTTQQNGSLFYLFVWFWLHWVFVAVRELFLDAGSDGYYPAVVQALLIA